MSTDINDSLAIRTINAPARSRHQAGYARTQGAGFIHLEITSITNNNYLVCKPVGAATGAINVAKPPTLQHSYGNYAGLTSMTTTDAQTVSATDGSTTETWKVSPPYAVGQKIWAVPAVTGLTVSSKDVVLMDDNRAGRGWCKT